MRVYVIGTVCILCVFSYILIYKPMHDELTKSKQQSFIHSAEAVGYAVEIFLDNIIDDAKSLSSRTMIKHKLIDYKNKTVSLEELEQYTTSRYYDGYNVLKRATGAFRVVDGNIITQQGDVDLSKAEHVEDITDVKLVLDTHDLSATVYSPIKEAGKILGYDIVFFNMADVLRGVHQNQMSHMICSYDGTQEILKHNSKIVLNKGEFLVPGKTNTWYIKDLQNAETFFITSIHNDILYKALQTLSANILFASPIIIFTLILIINIVTFKNFEHIIKQIEEAKDTYKKFATTDCLTNTFSRHYFNEYIETHASELFSGPLALVMIDIDDFKNINDTYGHLQGDEALREIAGILRSSVRSNDKVVRYGGDEFLLVLKDCTIKKAQEVLLRVVEGIKNIDKFDFNLGISYGISQVSNKEEFLLGIEEADKKMYEMKRDKYKIEK